MSDISSLFGNNNGLSNMLSDYSAIRSGSYKKLMKSYYRDVQGSSNNRSNSGSNNTLDRILEERRNPTVSKEVSSANSKLATSVSSYKNALSTLQNAKTYEDTENGADARDKVKNAIKSYVSAYNDSVTTAKKSTNLNMTSNVAGAMEATREESASLKELGVTLNSDGTLSFDEKGFKDVDLSKVKDAFDGNAALSYGSKVATRLNRISTSAISSNTSNTDVANTVSAVSNSRSLMESIGNLKNSDLYAKTRDASGNQIFDRDKVRAELERFAGFYNSTIDSAKSSGVSGVISNLATMQQKTSQNAYSLQQIGVSIGNDGKLSVNRDTFANASEDAIEKSVTDYASSIETNARLLNYYSTTQNGSSNSYSATGAYNTNPADIVSQMYDQI